MYSTLVPSKKTAPRCLKPSALYYKPYIILYLYIELYFCSLSYNIPRNHISPSYSSCSRQWGSASVVGVVRSGAVSVLAVVADAGHLYVCHAPYTIFNTLVHVLAKHHLSMVSYWSSWS